jgi:hypothetical protein
MTTPACQRAILIAQHLADAMIVYGHHIISLLGDERVGDGWREQGTGNVELTGDAW